MATATTITRTIPPPPPRCHMEGTGDGHPRSPPLSMPLSAVVAAAAAVTAAEVMTSVVEGGRERDQQPPSGAWLGSGYFGWPAEAAAMAAVASAAVGAGTAMAAAAAVSGAEACLPYLWTYRQAYLDAHRQQPESLELRSAKRYFANTFHRQRRPSPTPRIANTAHLQYHTSAAPSIANPAHRQQPGSLELLSPKHYIASTAHCQQQTHRLNIAHRQYRTSPPAYPWLKLPSPKRVDRLNLSITITAQHCQHRPIANPTHRQQPALLELLSPKYSRSPRVV